jgi:hypothetical protein
MRLKEGSIRPFSTKQFKWKKRRGKWGESFILPGEKTVFLFGRQEGLIKTFPIFPFSANP